MPTAKTNKTAKTKTAVRNTNRWVATVKTDSTHPPVGLFNRSAQTIARVLASKKVSPKGPVSGLRMLIYYMNRGGKGLTPERRAELEKAKDILSQRIRRNRKTEIAGGWKARAAG